ncbi:hypothetical protein [Pseudomonas piscis]|uniref:DUF4136 domain-containing protein n=1 Tax=Pseudomonas piscis TaxID=2614538 RepID=A0A7X1PPN7_9PSED|nr:hypothetical protein [Pseudomonas piscis]MCU7648494.1 hypothetical protein [Pseudomonas piscis]MQA56089.1 hypothetical protein [Pseudomonas piscis]
MMRLSMICLSMLLVPFSADAELEIRPLSSNTHIQKILDKGTASPRREAERKAGFPSFEQFSSMVTLAQMTDKRLSQAVRFKSESRAAIEKLRCQFSKEAPSGVEMKEGGLNGVMSLYSCGDDYVVTYETHYEPELAQRVVVYDDDYAKPQDPGKPLVKTSEKVVGGVRKTGLRWMNSKHEVRYDIYASLEGDGALEKALMSVITKVAIEIGKR